MSSRRQFLIFLVHTNDPVQSSNRCHVPLHNQHPQPLRWFHRHLTSTCQLISQQLDLLIMLVPSTLAHVQTSLSTSTNNMELELELSIHPYHSCHNNVLSHVCWLPLFRKLLCLAPLTSFAITCVHTVLSLHNRYFLLMCLEHLGG